MPKRTKDFLYNRNGVTKDMKSAYPWWPEGLKFQSSKQFSAADLKIVFDAAVVGADDDNAVIAAIRCCGVDATDMQTLINMTYHSV
jgi:hypothetical protein